MRQRAFTLIELLIVVVIVGVLAGVVVTNYTETRRRSVVADDEAFLESFKQSLALYRADNNGKLPAWNEKWLEPGEALDPYIQNMPPVIDFGGWPTDELRDGTHWKFGNHWNSGNGTTGPGGYGNINVKLLTCPHYDWALSNGIGAWVYLVDGRVSGFSLVNHEVAW